MYAYVCMYIYIYIYIFVYVEREREYYNITSLVYAGEGHRRQPAAVERPHGQALLGWIRVDYCICICYMYYMLS